MEYAEKISLLKSNVQQMLQERSGKGETSLPSPIWVDAIKVLDYVKNFSEEDFRNIRWHTGLIGGDYPFQYPEPYKENPEAFAEGFGYKFFTQDLPERYWVGEPPTPGIPLAVTPLPFCPGVNYRGKIINIDIIRYQCCISNLYTMGVMRHLESKSTNLIIEIGGGYGGLAHHLGNLLSGNSTYMIVDLPETLLFSGGYLIVNNPRKNIYIYQKSTFTPEFLRHEIYSYDYVLLPNYVLEDLYSLPEVNLMINMQSFLEMTREQLREYTEFGYSKLSGYLYSSNGDSRPDNTSLAPENVSQILSSRFVLFPSAECYRDYFKVPPRCPLPCKEYLGIPRGNKHLAFPKGGFVKVFTNREMLIFKRE